jgi:predicted component of type VI protein secretion system
MDPITQDVGVQVYPDSLLDLLNPQGFEKRFWELYRSQDWKSYEACYEALEEQRERYFNKRYYSEYASFRVANARRYKRLKS